VRLRMISPVNFRVVRPRLHAIVPPVGMPLFPALRLFQSAPPPHPRALPVRPHDPPRANSPVRQLYALRIDAANRRLPQHLHAAFFGPRNQPFMQQRPPQTDSRPLREFRKHPRVFLHKTDPAEFLPISHADFHSQGSQRRQRLRQHPFSAWLFNRRRRTIGHRYIKAFLARGNCRRQPRSPSAHYEYVCALSVAGHPPPFPPRLCWGAAIPPPSPAGPPPTTNTSVPCREPATRPPFYMPRNA